MHCGKRLISVATNFLTPEKTVNVDPVQNWYPLFIEGCTVESERRRRLHSNLRERQRYLHHGNSPVY